MREAETPADSEVVTLPVNHVVDGQDVVFRTNRGSKLSAAERQDHVAFEADDYDPRTRTGWSVLVKGRAEVVSQDSEMQRLSHLGLYPWVTAVGPPLLDPDMPHLGNRAADTTDHTPIGQPGLARPKRPGMQMVFAHTLAAESASASVLARCGFAQVAGLIDPHEGPVWHWELDLDDHAGQRA